jgi:hypothetical protein
MEDQMQPKNSAAGNEVPGTKGDFGEGQGATRENNDLQNQHQGREVKGALP